MPRYCLLTIGCQMNEADGRYVAAQLERRGYAPVARPRDADVVVLNTCVVRQQAEDRAYAILAEIEGLRARRPELRVALMGCLVGTRPAPDLARRFPFVDVFLPPSDFGPLLRLLDGEPAADDGGGVSGLRRADAERETAIRAAIAAADALRPPSRRNDPIAHLPVVLGCSQACTYCVIPYRRGRERSRPLAAVLAEARRLADDGVREIVLLGQIVDRYGEDLNDAADLADLLEAVARIPELRRVRFLTSHPSYLSERIIRAVAQTPTVCPVFELPVQSGNDAILAAMRRGYTADDYRRLTDRIRRLAPGATIHTDIIVGFPGETAAQFEDSVRLVQEQEFGKVHIAKYSPRPQTYAARRLPDDVPEAEKERRRAALDEVQVAIQARRNAELLGAAVEVLVDGRDEKRGRWRGRTADDRLVFFEAPEAAFGARVRVKIGWTGPFTLIGENTKGGGAEPRRPSAD